MKRLIFTTLIALLTLNINAQMFSSSEVLKSGEIEAGIHPANIDGESGVFLRGRIGTMYNFDISMTVGMLEGDNYGGIAIKTPVLNKIIDFSVIGGAHFYGGDFGMDVGCVADYNIDDKMKLFFGFDSDINIDDHLKGYFWIPLGFEYQIEEHTTLMCEFDMGLNSRSAHISQLGIRIFF